MKTVEVQLHGRLAVGLVALVDERDAGLVAALRWFVREVRTPGRHKQIYASANIRRNGKRTRIYMHALIAGQSGVDHVNRDGLDNRRANLRPATPSQQQGNRRGWLRSSSRFKGVHWDKNRRKWRASLAGRELGRFNDEVEAARVYDVAARARWGEFAAINFPGGTA